MADVELNIAEGLIVRPGDTLVIRVDADRVTGFAEVEDLKRQIVERLPAGAQVMVIACDQLAAVRSDGDVTNG